MKKLIAVLSVAMMVSGAFLALKPLKAHAVQAPKYRAKIFVGSTTCWAGGCDYPNGAFSSCTAMNTNGGPYFCYPGTGMGNGEITVGINPMCCDVNIDFGHWTKQRSDDGGFSWYDYPPYNSTDLVMPGGEEAVFEVQSDGSMDSGRVWATCSGGGGGQ